MLDAIADEEGMPVPEGWAIPFMGNEKAQGKT